MYYLMVKFNFPDYALQYVPVDGEKHVAGYSFWISCKDNGDGVTVEFTVKNVGAYSGKQVVQCYCSQPNGLLGKAESVLAILPLLSMLIIFGLFDGMTQQGRWQEFFLIFGGLVTVVGIVSIFLLPKETPHIQAPW